MDSTRSVRMDEETRKEFLGTGGTGVLSAGSGPDDPPYSLPVSYGYDTVEDDLYFRLAFSPESEKPTKLADRTPVSFVVHRQTDDGWRSVVARGRLEEVTEAAIDSGVVQAMQRIHIPLVDVFERHPRELAFRFFRLARSEFSGRTEARTAD